MNIAQKYFEIFHILLFPVHVFGNNLNRAFDPFLIHKINDLRQVVWALFQIVKNIHRTYILHDVLTKNWDFVDQLVMLDDLENKFGIDEELFLKKFLFHEGILSFNFGSSFFLHDDSPIMDGFE